MKFTDKYTESQSPLTSLPRYRHEKNFSKKNFHAFNTSNSCHKRLTLLQKLCKHNLWCLPREKERERERERERKKKKKREKGTTPPYIRAMLCKFITTGLDPIHRVTSWQGSPHLCMTLSSYENSQ